MLKKKKKEKKKRAVETAGTWEVQGQVPGRPQKGRDSTYWLWGLEEWQEHQESDKGSGRKSSDYRCSWISLLNLPTPVLWTRSEPWRRHWCGKPGKSLGVGFLSSTDWVRSRRHCQWASSQTILGYVPSSLPYAWAHLSSQEGDFLNSQGKDAG